MEPDGSQEGSLRKMLPREEGISALDSYPKKLNQVKPNLQASESVKPTPLVRPDALHTQRSEAMTAQPVYLDDVKDSS